MDAWAEILDAAAAGLMLAEPSGQLQLMVSTSEDTDVDVAQALTDLGRIGTLQERSIRESRTAREQLQRALNSRIVIEQTTGVLAQRHSLTMDGAFQALRSYARRTKQPLGRVAPGVVEQTIEPLTEKSPASEA